MSRGLHRFEKATVELCEFAQTESVPMRTTLVVDTGAREVILSDLIQPHPTRRSECCNLATTTPQRERASSACDGSHRATLTSQLA